MLGRRVEPREDEPQFLSLSADTLQPVFVSAIEFAEDAVIVGISDRRVQVILGRGPRWESFLLEREGAWRHLTLRKGVLFMSKSFRDLEAGHVLRGAWRRALACFKNIL